MKISCNKAPGYGTSTDPSKEGEYANAYRDMFLILNRMGSRDGNKLWDYQTSAIIANGGVYNGRRIAQGSSRGGLPTL